MGAGTKQASRKSERGRTTALCDVKYAQITRYHNNTDI